MAGSDKFLFSRRLMEGMTYMPQKNWNDEMQERWNIGFIWIPSQ
jgi:hypothetical protein